jgi:hypothetical protein
LSDILPKPADPSGILPEASAEPDARKAEDGRWKKFKGDAQGIMRKERDEPEPKHDVPTAKGEMKTPERVPAGNGGTPPPAAVPYGEAGKELIEDVARMIHGKEAEAQAISQEPEPGETVSADAFLDFLAMREKEGNGVSEEDLLGFLKTRKMSM